MPDARPAETGRNETRVPVTLLTGFLGAGKTTLLNRLLAEDHGERIAVVVNEFGDVGIDGRLVVGADEEVIELTNGCLCCAVRGDLTRALGDLLRRRHRRFRKAPTFDRIVIETSGLASPGPVLQTLVLEDDLAEGTVAAGVICLAHAAHVRDQLGTIPEVEEQIGYADAIVLNHCDQSDAEEIEAARAAIEARQPGVSLRTTTRADLDVKGLLKLVGAAGSIPTAFIPTPRHSDGAATVVLRTAKAVDLHRLKMWLQFLAANRSHDLWRWKGIFRCEGHSAAVVVQGVYQLLELGPSEEKPPEESVLVLIGRGMDREEIEGGWKVVVGE